MPFVQMHTFLLSNNLLTGPAFSPAWTLPGAVPNLIVLDLSGNNGITGTLPSSLSYWPLVQSLLLRNTSLRGTVPSQWCPAAFECLQYV